MESPIYRFGVSEFWLSETVFIQYSIHKLTYNYRPASVTTPSAPGCTFRSTIIVSFLGHLLCLVAVLAPLGLYINAKQQH